MFVTFFFSATLARLIGPGKPAEKKKRPARGGDAGR